MITAKSRQTTPHHAFYSTQLPRSMRDDQNKNKIRSLRTRFLPLFTFFLELLSAALLSATTSPLKELVVFYDISLLNGNPLQYATE